MNVTIDDAINAFNLLCEHVNENGFLYECYNLGISALKTIQDGNYQLEPSDVSRQTLERIATYDCTNKVCTECDYYSEIYSCISNKCRVLLARKEIEAWINQNVTN